MINYNSFTGIDFICDSQGCYSVNTALMALPSESNNSVCLPSEYVCNAPDYIASAFGLTSEEEYANFLNQAYSIFQQLILTSVPYIALYLDSQKAKAEISKFIQKYLPNLQPQSINQSLNKTGSIDQNLQDEKLPVAVRLKTIQDQSIVVGKDIANVTLASLKLTNALFPINTVTTLLQSEKIFTSLKKSKELYAKGNKKIDLSERLAKFGATALKMILTKKFLPGKFVTQSLSVTSSSLGYFKNIASKKKDLNFLLSGILLLGGFFKLENLIAEQFSSSEEKAA